MHLAATAALGELDGLVVKLQGPSLQVRQASNEVVRLQPLEAEKVFDAIRAKVRDAEDLMEEPAGVKGLVEIARHHSFLQRPLLLFIKDLPVSKIGPWVVSGWAVVFDNTDLKPEFEATLSEWAKQEDNKKLKAAANAAIKLASDTKRKWN